MHIGRHGVADAIAFAKRLATAAAVKHIHGFDCFPKVKLRITKLMPAKLQAGRTEQGGRGRFHLDIAERLYTLAHRRVTGNKPHHRMSCPITHRNSFG
jgi:hypothetical protein